MIGRRISHYQVGERLGAGGMGEVFEARDLALGRPVALKTLRPGFDPELRRRLLHEARISARLQHPGIATFHESGESDGVAFIAMELVAGTTLRQRLVAGPLPAATSLSIAGTVLEALGHAHASGILHRDIKPENVMVRGERGAKLLDFGLARALLPGEEAGAGLSGEEAASRLTGATTLTALTQAGAIVGTLGYMSPEQVEGGSIDARSDLFAVGALLYEMLAGRPAFPGGTPMESLAAILTREPPPLPVAGLPAGIATLLARALAKRAEERYPSARAFLADLQAIAEGDRIAPALPDSLAIVDLENVTGDPADNWIGSGMAETIGSELGMIPELRLIGRARVRAAREALAAAGSTGVLGLPEIGQALGCRWVLGGSYQRVGPALRVVVFQFESATGRPAWSCRENGTIDELFAIQDRVATVATEWFQAGPARAPLPPAAPPALAAYECYARGRRFWQRLEKGGFEQAQALYEQATAIDDRYAPAFAGLAAVHAMRFTFTTDPGDLETAARHARRAIELDPANGESHIWLAYALWRTGRPDESLAEADLACRFDGSRDYGHYFAGCNLLSRNRHAEALVRFQAAIEADAEHGFSFLGLGSAHAELGHGAEAAWCYRQAIAQESAGARRMTAGAAGLLGEHLRRRGALDEARRRCLEGIEVAEASDHMYRDTFRAIGLCALGRTALAQADAGTARAAFGQAVLHLRGRPRALGGGHLLVQALAGVAQADRDPNGFREARTLFETRAGFNFSWFWTCTENQSLLELSRAARAAGDEVSAEGLRARAVAAGSVEALGEAVPPGPAGA